MTEPTSAESVLSGSDPSEADALISRLRVIEAQPLSERAAAFAQLYDTLQSVLGGSGGGSDGDASGR